MASTLHYLSGGRFILGIGAGWKDDEYRAYGWEFPSPAVRSKQLEEYAQIIKLMLTQSPASFQGRYYSIHAAHNDPLPNPRLPLMIGGGGERKTLRTAAKYADWWNSPWRAQALFAHQVDVLKAHCLKVGRDFGEIVLTTCQMVTLSEDPSKVKPSAAPSTMHVIAGDADAVTRELEQFVQLGARHIMLRFRDFPSTEGIELFLRKVLPRFR
jgi:alkanesulfonate monooxygenase SsuD/methylene tetrahydromethanopterin reductase-like flavin-dependent oxidoreductase (luciferase family)